jgi:hypothetical protein
MYRVNDAFIFQSSKRGQTVLLKLDRIHKTFDQKPSYQFWANALPSYEFGLP